VNLQKEIPLGTKVKQEVRVLSPDLMAFVSKTAVSAAVGVIMAILIWPFRKARKEWIELKNEQALIHEELVKQRTNCLSTLQNQGVEQIKLLGNTVAALNGVRLDLADQTGYLRAMTAQPPRRRRTDKK
jgi:hypothetical protein